MARDTVGRTFTVALVLCVVCSILVSSTAVALRERQQRNVALDIKKNILAAAGHYDPNNPPRQSIESIFENKVERILVDLDTGRKVDESTVDPQNYDPREAARTVALSEEVEPPEALPGIRRREKYAFVYLFQEDGNLKQMVFPIYGKGLWSTLYGFIAIDDDTTTVNGITFYEHAETPGLGGEVDSPSWKAQWQGKQVYDDQWNLEIEVIKGEVNEDNPEAEHRIDGLAGATITTRGVSNLVRYWLSEDAFGSFLARVRANEGTPVDFTATSQPSRSNRG